MTREAIAPSDPGWLQDQVAKSVASLDSLPPNLRASLAQPTTRRGHHMTTINDEAVRAAIDAAFPGLPAGMTLDEAERRMRAGLAAALVASGWRPEADVLREAADEIRGADSFNYGDEDPEDWQAIVAAHLEMRADIRERYPATAPEPVGAHAQGYAEAVARLRDDARYRDWWTSGGVKPDAPIRRHLADYLETVGPDGPDVTTGRWPAREQAVVRAAIAWRRMRLGKPTKPNPESAALIEAVDALGAPPVADGSDVDSAENRVEYGAVHGTCEHWGSWPTAQSLISWLAEQHSDWRPLIRVTSGAGLDQLRPAPVAGSFGAVVHEQTGLKGTSKGEPSTGEERIDG